MSLIVQIETGKIRGKTKLNYDGEIFYSFQGIPYAKPPIGELRFKAPEPLAKWKETFDATKEGEACYAHNMLTQEIQGSEDCLFINVFTPAVPTERRPVAPKPVMFWVHGGAFFMGSSKTDIYGPEFLLTKDVVVVTFNYRLGILGFLTLEDESLEVPGNAAMKDMVLALKWVQKNIGKFAGDPGNVTIFGESAGSAAVHYLMLSPLAKGLFHKVIAQSGNALLDWAVGKPTTRILAKILNLNAPDEKKILHRLQELPISELLAVQDELHKENLGESIYFAPTIEKPSPEAFISDDPLNIIRSGNYIKVPMIIGYTKHEGMLGDLGKLLYHQAINIMTDFEKSIPANMGIAPVSTVAKKVAQKIKEFYFGDDEPSMENKENEYNLKTDNEFFRETITLIRETLKTSTAPIYFYRFSLQTRLNYFSQLVQLPFKGCCHGDDLGYIFKTSFTPKLDPGSPEDVAVRRMIAFWTNFAVNGDPNPKNSDPLVEKTWKAVTKDALHFMDIGEELLPGTKPEAERIEFWDELYKNYGKKLGMSVPN